MVGDVWPGDCNNDGRSKAVLADHDILSNALQLQWRGERAAISGGVGWIGEVGSRSALKEGFEDFWGTSEAKSTAGSAVSQVGGDWSAPRRICAQPCRYAEGGRRKSGLAPTRARCTIADFTSCYPKSFHQYSIRALRDLRPRHGHLHDRYGHRDRAILPSIDNRRYIPRGRMERPECSRST